MKACPNCKSKSRLRIPTPKVLKKILKVGNYLCYDCSAIYVWIGIFNHSFLKREGRF